MATAELNVIEALRVPYEQVGTMHHDSRQPIRRSRSSVADSIGLGLFIYERLKAHTDEWAASIEHGGRSFDWNDSRELSGQFKWWLGCSRNVLAGIESLQGSSSEEYRDIPGLDAFKAAIRDVSVMDLDTDRTMASIQSLKSGGGVSLERAREELRANPR